MDAVVPEYDLVDEIDVPAKQELKISQDVRVEPMPPAETNPTEKEEPMPPTVDTKKKHAIVGGSKRHDGESLPARVRVFIEQAHNNMRRVCGLKHTSVRRLKVAKWSTQVTGGTLYTVKYTPEFKISGAPKEPKQFEMQIEKLAAGKVHAGTRIHENFGSAKQTADKFKVVSMKPLVCSVHNIYQTKKKKGELDARTADALLQAQRYTGHV